MTRILQATCRNGELVLTEKLDVDLEGKAFKVMILEVPDIQLSANVENRSQKITRFLEKAKQYSLVLPQDYRFDRNEIYDRQGLS
jgi:hypothetical protein